ncbi:hypothetical protein [uncultured Bacteroides sp.]|uniref:hypothetical protein n=1 Tax=uncultured Bacteroides sp. TaxID=162156 RepID=UPI0025E2CA68|nr:hypothetical protein [uncultured Bacteroides sp.]
MNKFITVTSTKGFTYSLNVSHIIGVQKDDDGTVIKHTPWGENNTSTLIVKEAYDYVMNMINS